MTIIQQTMDIIPSVRIYSENKKANREHEVYNDKIHYPTGANISVEAFCADLAKENIKMGRNAAFKWLRDNGYISKQKSTWNMPLPKYISQNILSVKETFVFIADEQVAKYSPRITPKGKIYLMQKIKSDISDKSNSPAKRQVKRR